MAHPLESFEDAERIRLVELDLTMTNEFIRGVIATSTAIRGVAVTVWLALLGVAGQQQLTSLALLACVVAFIFWIVDAYHGWLYTEASVHARSRESLVSDYYNAISRAQDDPEVIDRLRVTLRAQTFGLFRTLRSGYGVKNWWNARPRLLYRAVYLSMMVLALAIALLVIVGVIGPDAAPSDPRPTPDPHHHHGGSRR